MRRGKTEQQTSNGTGELSQTGGMEMCGEDNHHQDLPLACDTSRLQARKHTALQQRTRRSLVPRPTSPRPAKHGMQPWPWSPHTHRAAQAGLACLSVRGNPDQPDDNTGVPQ